MKNYLDCYPCFLRQALSASRRAGASDDQQRLILLDTMEELRSLSVDATPPQMAFRIHQLVRQQTNNLDPYRHAKNEATQQALALYPRLKELVERATDPLETAVRIAIAGNIIDLGVNDSYDLEATLDRILIQAFAINDLGSLRSSLTNTSSILYLADNAGETVFDRVLIETLDIPVTYVVKSGPIINDAIREDAVGAGINLVAEIIDNGSDVVGTLLDDCSESFRKRFERAELIIAKGQANYESLSDTEAPLFFLLQAKCNIIAQDLGVTEAAVVLKQQTVENKVN
jgi:uncharacterized protein with ATP-grasp and redox domains